MSFNPRMYWYVGKHLENFSKKEEYKRSAVNRYYYSSFINARDFYEERTSEQLPKVDSHQTLISFFQDSKNIIETCIGDELDLLKFYRTSADYMDDFQDYYVEISNSLSNHIIYLLDKLNKR